MVWVDYFAERTFETIHVPSIKTVKSSTLNRHHFSKPKSPGRNQPSLIARMRFELFLTGNIFKKIFRRRRSASP